MDIGSRMKECRIILGYSAEQVAAKLNVSPATIYRYEKGDISKMPSQILKPLADYLLTTPGYLMGWSEEGRPPISLTPSEQDLILYFRSLDDVTKNQLLCQIKVAELQPFTSFESQLIHAYRAADPSIQAAIRKLLDLPDEDALLGGQGHPAAKIV